MGIPGSAAGYQRSERHLWPHGLLLTPGSGQSPGPSAIPPGHTATSPVAMQSATAKRDKTREESELNLVVIQTSILLQADYGACPNDLVFVRPDKPGMTIVIVIWFHSLVINGVGKKSSLHSVLDPPKFCLQSLIADFSRAYTPYQKQGVSHCLITFTVLQYYSKFIEHLGQRATWNKGWRSLNP